MEALEAQSRIVEEIEKIERNLKKDSLNRKNIEYYNKRIQILDEFFSSFQSNHKKLLETLSAEDEYLKQDLFEAGQKKYLNLKIKLVSELASLLTTSQMQQTGQNNFSESSFQTAEQSNQQAHPTGFQNNDQRAGQNTPKLPPINIPIFTGSSKDYQHFIDLFKAVIDCNSSLGDIQKLQYLLGYLQGEAKDAVSHLRLSASSYSTALLILENRFSNKRQAAMDYIDSILDVKKLNYRSAADVISLYDTICSCLAGLKNLGYDTSHWGPLVIRIAMRKFDNETLRLFEEGLDQNKEFPSIESFTKFLLRRYQLLNTIKTMTHEQPGQKTQKHKSYVATYKNDCIYCKGTHKIFSCDNFKKLAPEQRTDFIDNKSLCRNCLSHGNSITCKSKIRCFECNKPHHTLLHLKRTMTAHIATGNKIKSSTVLLATALLKVKNNTGQYIILRALIDPGSQTSFISAKAAKKLGLPKRNTAATITGIGGVQAATVNKKIKIHLAPAFESKFTLIVEVYIMTHLTTLLPEGTSNIRRPKWTNNLNLADPEFEKPSSLDLILGADVFEDIIQPDIIRGKPLLAQKTQLGWILSGKIPLNSDKPHVDRISCNVSTTELYKSMQKFFDSDVGSSQPTRDEDECEIIYQSTTARDSDGRYFVALPFKDVTNIPPLGNSRNRAMVIYKHLEKRLMKDEALRKSYNDVLREYIDLGHMELASPYIGEEKDVYYLPHHAVIKSQSTTTKVRVVFNASSKTTSGSSLNDLLHTGRQLQETLACILLRWRTHKFVYVADIEKMFRMIKILPSFKNFHRILWRPDENGPIQEYIINVVVFGKGPSNFLSVRTLHQLADDEHHKYPIAAERIKKDFYVDNFMSGAETVNEAKTLQEQMVKLLNAGGFNLRQWATNDKTLLENIPEELREVGLHGIVEDSTINTLGIQWNPQKDDFRFKTIKFGTSKSITKRQLLSNIATIYDPLQWLAPVTIVAKILMQRIWESGIGWDDVPSDNILKTWRKLEDELPLIESIRVPRWIHFTSNCTIEHHGFCDASEAAHAAVIYSRTIDSDGRIKTTILCAKTRVTPLKSKITLPRLELNGAVLLAESMQQTISSMQLHNTSVHCWCDSTIVLAWLQKDATKLENYVANRVGKIRNASNDAWSWNHIKSNENPADCASRGITPSELKRHDLWWNGPEWLFRSSPPATIISFSGITNQDDILQRFSNFNKLVRVSAYCARFLTKHKGPITPDEFEQSRLKILRLIQETEFAKEIQDFKAGRPLKKKLRNLRPFIDSRGILRVGGRLRHADITHDHKYPILLPSHHHVTFLIIREAHRNTMHGTIAIVRNYLRMRYWIINDQKVIRNEIHRCLTCLRYSRNNNRQVMADLPAFRLIPTPPFCISGVDFTGPFKTRVSKGRNTMTLKGYVCVFVCMVTKAVHLELVSDLTTEAFLAAFKRFISRRGLCSEIFSDHGTNFVGANNQMDKEMYEAIESASKNVARISAKDGVTWKFIPVATPHFGGLWEAAVKSAKRQLKCVLDEAKITPTFEEFTTILCTIESCLNSRPLVPLSSNPEDLEALTPAHFLVQRPMLALPEVDRTQTTLYDRWQQLKGIHQEFWKRWTSEYLHLLQLRTKWTKDQPDIKVGELVLIRERDTPPNKWPLARIQEIHPGADGKVRAVTIRYNGNNTKQIGIINICPLPIDTPSEPEKTHQLPNKPKKFPPKRPSSSHNSPIAKKSTHQPKLNVKKPKIAPCTWARSILNIALIFLTFGAVFTQNISTDQYQIWKPDAGFYVEKLGHSRVIRGNLRIEVSLPIKDIFSDQENMSVTLNKTTDMCKRTQDLAQTTHCDSLLKHLTIKHNDLIRKINELLTLTVSKRQKRGILGKMMTAIFGVNDEIYSEISDIHQNNQRTLHAMNQQNILVNSKIDTFSSYSSQKLQEFTKKLNDVIGSVNYMSNWYAKIDHGRLGVQVISTYLTASDYYDELHTKYDKFTKILYGNGNILSFVNLAEIENAIHNASISIGTFYTILRTPLHRTTLTRTEEEISVYGYFYIVENSEYELFHVTAIPQEIRAEEFIIPHSDSSTFAVDFDHETYFELNQQELDACKTIDKNQLCSPKLIKNINPVPNCIIDTIYGRPNKPLCQSYHIKSNETSWKELMAPNSWLFVTSIPITASIICSGQRFEESLEGVGIIHTLGNCLTQAQGINLRSTISEHRIVSGSFLKTILPTQSTAFERTKPTNTKIRKLVDQIFQPPIITGPTISPFIETVHHHYVITTATLFIVLVTIIIGLILCSYRKALCSQTCRFNIPTNSADQPTSTTNEDIPLSRRFQEAIGRPPAC